MAEQGGLSADTRALMVFQAKKKSVGLSYALWFFIGLLGAHRFYNGKFKSGAMMAVLGFIGLAALMGGSLFPLAIVGFWAIYDACVIPRWVGASNARLLAAIDSGSTAAMLAA